MSRTVNTRLGNALFFPAYTIVVQSDCTGQGDFEIVGVELYCDAEYKRILADHMLFNEFDAVGQKAIHDALDIHDGQLDAERTYTLQEVAAEVQKATAETVATVARLTAENEALRGEVGLARRIRYDAMVVDKVMGSLFGARS